ncbi:MAG: threonine--tRNA ligase [Bacteroidota bacterium]
MSQVKAPEQTIQITLPNGDVKSFPAGTTAMDVAKSISNGLAQKTLVAKVNGTLRTPTRPINEDATLELLSWDDAEGKQAFWHSSAHLLAEAVQALYPNARFGIGPAIDEGFYYDIDFGDEEFSENDLEKVEKKMLELARTKEHFQMGEWSKEEALNFYREKDNPYKLELIGNLQDGDITYCQNGEFIDLCRGGHIPHSKHVKAIKLLKVAGAYWRGDASNPQLTRIYGISFPKAKMLEDYLHRLEEAKKRDHRLLGKQLNMFSFHDEGPGFPFWHHNGMVVFQSLQAWLRKMLIAEYGYEEIQTPPILNVELWQRSGHYQNYAENMYFTEIDEQQFAVKPMNCPGSTIVYGTNPHSYKELPIRLFEFGKVHRHELSGALHGLFRVRAFTQDDAHVFCLPDQIEEEIITLIKLIFRIYATFGFNDVNVFLSTKPEKAMGSDEIWAKSEAALEAALAKHGVDYTLNPGDGAFYGPKIDFVVKDSLQREWQLGTIQLDFSMPERFDLTYKGEDSQLHRPVMIHRAILGSFERFIGVLLEHTAGNLPLWMAPLQAAVLPISDKVNDYAAEVVQQFKAVDLRLSLDDRDERISRKIFDAETSKIPYMIVIGQKEAEAGQVTLRQHGGEDLGAMSVEDAITKLQNAVADSYTPEIPTAEVTE